jgi:hypothetical protein
VVEAVPLRNIDASTHCKENPFYVFLFWELRGLSPNFHIRVSVSDFYIPIIGPHISCCRIFFFKFSLLVLCSAYTYAFIVNWVARFGVLTTVTTEGHS